MKKIKDYFKNHKTEAIAAAIVIGPFVAIMVTLQFFVGWESAFMLSLAVMLVALAVYLVYTFFNGSVKNSLALGLALWAVLLAVVSVSMALKQYQP